MKHFQNKCLHFASSSNVLKTLSHIFNNTKATTVDYGVTCGMKNVYTNDICKSIWCNNLNTNPQCGPFNSPWSPSGNGCWTTKDPLEQVRSEVGMQVGSIYTYRDGVDWMWPLPNQPMDTTCPRGGEDNWHIDCSWAITWFVDHSIGTNFYTKWLLKRNCLVVSTVLQQLTWRTTTNKQSTTIDN